MCAPMNQFTITPETCSRKVNGVNFDFTFTLMHVPVVIVNDSFVQIKKVIHCLSFHQALLFFNHLPSSLNPVTSQLTRSFFFFFSHRISCFTRKHVTLRKHPDFNVDWSRCVLFVRTACSEWFSLPGNYVVI